MINNLLDEGSFRRWDDGTPVPVITGEASSTPSSPPETSRALALLPADRVIVAPHAWLAARTRRFRFL